MNLLITIILLFASSTVFACPNLEGTYSACYEDQIFDENNESIGGRVHNVIIEQDKVDGSVAYSFKYKDNNEDDGTIRSHGTVLVNKKTVINKFDFWTRTDVKHELSAKCQGDSLIINSKVIQNEKAVSETTEVFTKLPDSKMKHTIKGLSRGKSISIVRDCQL